MSPIQLAALFDLAASDGADSKRHEPNTWRSLEVLQLVDVGEHAFMLSERGWAYVQHVCALPLPELTWRMPDGTLSSGTFSESGTFTKAAWDGLVRINRPPAPVPGDEGPAPPPPPLRPKRIIPTDPDELRSEAIRLMDQGFGMNEVKEQLELTETQAQQFFFNQ